MLTKIHNDMKQAMKAGEKLRLSTIRLLLASIKNVAIEKRQELEESEIITIIQREVKQRRNAMEEYIKGKRDDLVEQAKAEIAVLESYLPQQLSDEELGTMAKQIIEELKATPKEFGKVMGKLVPMVKGKADGTRVQAVVKKLLE
jgi:uncharacterized protein